MKIADILEPKNIVPHLHSTSKAEVIKELADNISSVYPNINRERLVEVLLEREKLCSTAVDSGVAIPHAKISGVTDITLGFGRSIEGIEFESIDRKETHFFITLIAPGDAAGSHIGLLARISKVFKNPELRSRLMKLESQEDIYEAITIEDEKY